MKYQKITVSKTAHYCVLGQPGPHIRQLWIVCHGYAQLASEFIENFRQLDNGQTLVIAPEGMNHFYQKGFSGPVVANWMTRHHREDEIADYSYFLQTLYNHYTELLPYDVRIVFLGFSQGTATVAAGRSATIRIFTTSYYGPECHRKTWIMPGIATS